jgi:hypothetical protein
MALDVLGPMTRFSGECSACPLLLDVLSELHKLPYFLVELGLHLADLLKLCVLTLRRDWTTASSRGMPTREAGPWGSSSSGIPRWLPSSRSPRSTWKHSRIGPQPSSSRLWPSSEQPERQKSHAVMKYRMALGSRSPEKSQPESGSSFSSEPGGP